MAVLQYDLKKFAECQANVDILLTKSDIGTIKVTLNNAENKQNEYPIKASILNLKGMLAQQTGDKAAARKAFEDALTVAADFPLAKQNLAKLK
jgi:Tfp pilus assembly protein PilF